MTEKPLFNMEEQARRAAEAMNNHTLSYEERARITNPREVDQLSSADYKTYQDLMIVFMRELRSIPVSHQLEEGQVVEVKEQE